MSETATKAAIAKKIEVIIKPGKLDAVKKAMSSVGYAGVTISQAEGHGAQKGLTPANGGFRLELLPKIRMEIVVAEGDAPKLIDAIIKAAQTGEPGDGKIFVSDVQEVIRIRTGERGRTAI